jgi:hypothetical protein
VALCWAIATTLPPADRVAAGAAVALALVFGGLAALGATPIGRKLVRAGLVAAAPRRAAS